jgi:hypothetical protein
MRPVAGPMSFVVSSAVLMCLGWGLRGYIGGGPMGAMIPGAFIALWLCLLLGIDTRRTAVIAALGTLGIAIGGEMTYGQTLGFLRDQETVWWGLLGTVVKGGAWGLLGGALLGLGFEAQKLSKGGLALVLGVFLLACIVGIAVINQPKLIYFSDPINKPRAEVWAGLLLGALALLGILRVLGVGPMPGRFAAYGFVGGMAGFGIGGVLMAIGFQLEPPYRGLPWWKFMEFTFGACLGLAYGACAWRYREPLTTPAPAVRPTPPPWTALALGIVLVLIVLFGWIMATESLIDYTSGSPLQRLLMPFALVLLGYSTLACVLMVWSVRSETVAWHTVVTLTFVHCVLDLQEDLGPEQGIDAPAFIRWGLLLGALAISAALVVRWQRNPNRRLAPLLLWLMWGCMVVAYARILCSVPVLLPTPENGITLSGLPLRFVHAVVDHGIVHGIFTACAIYCTFALWPWRKIGDAQAAA